MIAVSDLSVGYPGREVLSGVNCTVKVKRLTMILGRNGSGKSTLLRAMAGLLPYQKGSILLDGREISNLPNNERTQSIGFLGQHHRPVFPFQVRDVVLTGRAGSVRFLPTSHDHAAAQKALTTIGILPLADRIYSELSGGEQQLVMIARVLAREPRILLLDEPLSHLDYPNQIHLLTLLSRLVSHGITVILIVHDPNLAFLFGQEFWLVHQGSVTMIPGKDVAHSPLLEEMFRMKMIRIPHGDKYFVAPQLDLQQ